MSNVVELVEVFKAQVPNDAMGEKQEENVKMVKTAIDFIARYEEAAKKDNVDPVQIGLTSIAFAIVSHGAFVADGLEDAAAVK